MVDAEIVARVRRRTLRLHRERAGQIVKRHN
jgi:hypothetical protein